MIEWLKTLAAVLFGCASVLVISVILGLIFGRVGERRKRRNFAEMDPSNLVRVKITLSGGPLDGKTIYSIAPGGRFNVHHEGKVHKYSLSGEWPWPATYDGDQ